MRFLAMIVWITASTSVHSADPATGFQTRAEVKQATRLDWEFVASGFGKDALKLPGDFDSKQQRFQLYVPKTYRAERAWPLVVFVSPGDDPLGWRYWQKVCESNDILFCAAYGAGNNCPAGKRIRIVLDMLDQVRRDYRIDPERTVITGFSGGGRVACTIGFSLPEYFGGVIPVCGTNPLSNLDYLRHRAQDRLSVAFLTGETDFNREENEKYMAPFVAQLGIRSKLWVVPKLGHGVPGEQILKEVFAWIESDLKRRRDEAKERPSLACPPDDQLAATSLAARLLEAAEAELKEDKRLWRGVVMIQGILARWPRTPSGTKARKLLDELKDDKRRIELAGEQGGLEERVFLMAQAQAFERWNKTAGAMQAWKMLAEQHPESEEGRKASEALRRLSGAATKQPYLGIGFAGESLVLDRVVPGSPADKGGVQVGDRLKSVNGTALSNLDSLRKSLEKVKPGDTLTIKVERKGKTLDLSLKAEMMQLPKN